MENLGYFIGQHLQEIDYGVTPIPSRNFYQNIPEYPPALLGDEWPTLSPGGVGLPRGVIQNTPQGKGEGEMI
jgi:hypothetical protein